ncbi:SMI1/KNR4 family protein [Streptomyces sp. PSRA5]|uniref:SMI1/KNR4 family protein n=1 Tax=Streptomyces panacea TaxID=3035064 RepID=UPI00339C93F8
MNAESAEVGTPTGESSGPVDERVRRAWELIAGRLPTRGPLPGTVGTVVDEARVAEVERVVGDELGVRLPPDLVALWWLDAVHAGHCLPSEGAFSLDGPQEALELRKFMLDLAEAEDPDDPAWPDRFTEDLLPIGTSPGGDSLVVRLRPDEHHGNVHFWDHEVWGLGVPLWPSVAAMLDDAASALLSGGPALTWHVANGGDQPLVVPLLNERGRLTDWEASPGPAPGPEPDLGPRPAPRPSPGA